MLESAFELLFKYRPVVFERGELAFDASRGAVGMATAALALGGLALLTYGTTRMRSATRDRVVLGSIRAAALLVLAACLFRPVMLMSAAVPQRNVVGILLDDSRSMRIADAAAGGDGRALGRGSYVQRALAADSSALVRALAERFALRFFRFSASAERTGGSASLAFAGTGTHVGASLESARQALAGVPLAALVLVSDGADNSTGALSAQLQSLTTWSVPVFTVGVGRERFDRDVQVDRVEAPRTALAGSLLAADVVVTHTGFGGRTVPLVVEEEGRIVTTQPVTLPAAGEATVVHVSVPLASPGVQRLTFRVPVQDGETVARNNERGALVRVREGRDRILYVEGEPRWEMPFMRRAIAHDERLQLVTLQRTADGKFLRLDVRDSAELATGFPTARAELFAYRAIVLGSVEASFFTLDQLRMLAEFVSVRGGGLLALGGHRALGEGGYGETPLADVLPVALDAPSPTPAPLEVHVEPTRAGALHPVTHVGTDERAPAERWKTLPPLTVINRIGRPKPGAVTLLRGTGNAVPDALPVLVAQRYGRGMSVVFTPHDSWLWRMHAAVPRSDATHERFWRQVLRWLASDAADPVRVAASRDRVEVGEPVALTAEVRDSVYAAVRGAQVVAHVTTPAGVVRDVPLQPAAETDGEYRGVLAADAPGLYAVRVEARPAHGAALPTGASDVEAGDLGTEFFDAAMRAPLLRRIARETGGRFYTPATVAALPKDIVYTRSGTTTLERMELWDMPAVFLLLVLLVGGEWAYRKRRGLA